MKNGDSRGRWVWVMADVTMAPLRSKTSGCFEGMGIIAEFNEVFARARRDGLPDEPMGRNVSRTL